MALPELLSRYLAHFGEPLPPVLTGDAADWVKEDFMRQALRRVGGDGNRNAALCGGPVGAQHATPSRPAGEECSETRSPMRLAAQGVACCAPTKTVNVAGECHDKRPQKNLLTDERLDTAPEGVRDARRRLRGLIPEASRLHLELVVASRDPTAENNKEKAHKLKARRAKLVEKLCEILDERDSLWAVIEDYLTKADG